jgi:hypothetical protein
MENKPRRRSSQSRMASPVYRADVLEVLTRLLAMRPDVTPGKMFGFPAFYTKGKLFACVFGKGVGLKLPQETIRQLEGKPGIGPFQPYGKPKMKEWILIHHSRPASYANDAPLFTTSIAFVAQTARRSNKSQRTQPARKRP